MALKNWLKGAAIGAAGLLTPITDAHAQQNNDIPQPVQQELEEGGEDTYILHENDLDNDGQNDIYIVSVMNSDWNVPDDIPDAIAKFKKKSRHSLQTKTPTDVFYRKSDGGLGHNSYNDKKTTKPVDRDDAGFWVDNTGENPIYITDEHVVYTSDREGEAVEVYSWEEASDGFKHDILWKKDGFDNIDTNPTFDNLYKSDQYQPLGDYDDGELYQPDDVTTAEN